MILKTKNVVKCRYLPYSGTCPVPLFRRRRTRLPPDLISSMALEWVMSRVLSPLISMIWSPTCMSEQRTKQLVKWNCVWTCRLSCFFLNRSSKRQIVSKICNIKVWRKEWKSVFFIIYIVESFQITVSWKEEVFFSSAKNVQWLIKPVSLK